MLKWLLLLIPLAGLADDRTIRLAHGADAGTTAIGILVAGAVEANPLAIPMFPVSVWITERDRGKCSERVAAIESMRWAASSNNLLVILGAGPISLLALPVVGSYVWHRQKQAITDCKVQALKRIFRGEA